MSGSLSTSLTSATSTSGVLMKEGVVRVSGTFSATLRIEVDALGDGTWAPALDSTGAVLEITEPGVMHVDNGVACPTRVTCSSYTSGTVNVALRD